MAPYLQESTVLSSQDNATAIPPTKSQALKYEPGRTKIETHENYEYEHLLPSFPNIKWPALTEVPYHDRGLDGDENFGNLLSVATGIQDYNPKIGTEISGVDLTKLAEPQKNDLARLIATRGVVFFRNQENFDIEAQRELGKYFGTLHKHATTSTPRQPGLEDVHVVFTEGNRDMRAMFTPTFLWHSDVGYPNMSIGTSVLTSVQVTYEIQPPSYTSLKVLTGPPIGGGGDTLWSSQYAAYDALSAPMQKYLEGLTALHSAQMQADGSVALGRIVRREPVVTEHPLIRTNPVTGWKSLFLTQIVGIPKIESDHIISYLNEVISTTNELHVRFQWGKNDVAFWDNRICNHSASYGFAPHRRHAVRVACHAERPYLDPASKSQEEELHARYGLPPVNKNGAGQSNYND
ncbi:hypothetical protein H2203_003159 [Taxawa tesnikishii (nom. ined.)]|nr:hypothetical protein H2203_003159 [Dothideales sp. JES 119]